ncbi:MAG: hypothetical protein ACFCGT_13685 [Sandaracinaceae bacterium]
MACRCSAGRSGPGGCSTSPPPGTVDLLGLAHRLSCRGDDPEMVARLLRAAEARDRPSLRLVLPD